MQWWSQSGRSCQISAAQPVARAFQAPPMPTIPAARNKYQPSWAWVNRPKSPTSKIVLERTSNQQAPEMDSTESKSAASPNGRWLIGNIIARPSRMNAPPVTATPNTEYVATRMSTEGSGTACSNLYTCQPVADA